MVVFCTALEKVKTDIRLLKEEPGVPGTFCFSNWELRCSFGVEWGREHRIGKCHCLMFLFSQNAITISKCGILFVPVFSVGTSCQKLHFVCLQSAVLPMMLLRTLEVLPRGGISSIKQTFLLYDLF